MDGWVERHVLSWVVTDEGSKPELIGINPKLCPYFKVVSLDRLPQVLSFLRADPLLLSSAEVRCFIELVGARPVPSSEWYRGLLVESSFGFVGLIPKITNWMDAEEYGTLARALRYVRELELKQHLPHVIRCWHNRSYPDLRKDANARAFSCLRFDRVV